MSELDSKYMKSNPEPWQRFIPWDMLKFLAGGFLLERVHVGDLTLSPWPHLSLVFTGPAAPG